MVAKRTLLTHSLLGVCKTPLDIGRFVLLDVNVGGIPTVNSLFVPGVPSKFDNSVPSEFIVHNFQERGPDVDFTSHIEADWDGNPDNVLLCFRYKGRRIGSMNPYTADLLFCYTYVKIVKRHDKGPQYIIIPAIKCKLSDF